MGAIDELRKRDQWVAYNAQKIPMQYGGQPASSTDPATWTSADRAKFCAQERGLAGVGFVFSPDDPYVGVDLDGAIDAETGDLHGWALDIVRELDSYTELSPSRLGVHIIVKGALPRNGAKSREGDAKVEVYQQARYFTVTGLRLPWSPDEIRERDMGTWFAKQFPARVTATAGRSYEVDFPTTENTLSEALTYIDAFDRETWVRVGMAIKSELGDRGFAYWDMWSSSCSDKYDAKDSARRWRGFKPDGSCNISTVYWLAREGGYNPHFVGTWQGNAWLEKDDAFWHDFMDEAEAEQEHAGRGLEIRWIDAADAYADDSPYEPDLISPGVLSGGDCMVIAGPPKSMKSFITLDMMRSFALGVEWHGFKPTRPLRIAYMQFELKADAMRKRLMLAHIPAADKEALRKRFIYTPRFVPPPIGPEMVEVLKQGLGEGLDAPVDVLVMDPLANIFQGKSESDNTEMIAFLRLLKILRNNINPECCLVLVHHSSKRNKDERTSEPFNAIRGASALRGFYDAGVYVEAIGPSAVKVWQELRNGPGREPMELAMNNGQFTNLADKIKDDVVTALLEDAADGIVHTKSKFAQAHAAAFGLDARAFGGLLKSLEKEGWLFTWQPSAQQVANGLKLHPNAAGFLGVRGMRFKGEIVQ